jgi:DNA-directed RNA polymerase specialized sigma24 family protein
MEGQPIWLHAMRTFPAVPPTTSFPATLWTQVMELQSTADPARREKLLGEFWLAYYYPLYAYVRRCGHDLHEAEDLTQSFFLQHFVERRGNLMTHVDRGKGKLRSLLLAGMQNVLNDWRKHQHAVKRGGGAELLSFDAMDAEERYRREPHDTSSPEAIYHRQFAKDFVAKVTEALRDDFISRGKLPEYEALRPYLLAEGNAEAYAAAGAGVGVTLGNFKVMVHRLRKRYREIFRGEVAKTLDAPTEAAVDAEIRELVALSCA